MSTRELELPRSVGTYTHYRKQMRQWFAQHSDAELDEFKSWFEGAALAELSEHEQHTIIFATLYQELRSRE